MVQTYRCYFLDAANHIIRAEACESADDTSAVCWAEVMCRTSRPAYAAVELWCRDRMLQRRAIDRARARSVRELDQSRRKGFRAIAEQYDRLADANDSGLGLHGGDGMTGL